MPQESKKKDRDSFSVLKDYLEHAAEAGVFGTRRKIVEIMMSDEERRRKQKASQE